MNNLEVSNPYQPETELSKDGDCEVIRSMQPTPTQTPLSKPWPNWSNDK